MSAAAQGARAMVQDVQQILAQEDDEAFRSGLRAWFSRELPRVAGERYATADMHSIAFRREWEDHVCHSGLSGLGWPKEAGGHALSLRRQAIYHEEYARSKAPLSVNLIGHGIVAPTLIVYGSEEQKARYLPPLMRNDELWCQGYSEPGSGSDLAALATRAERRGDIYVINGQKIWTSFANIADMCLLLVRTDADAKPRHGISVLLVDMKTPGITARPIRQITGEADFNEVFFDNAEVPVTALLGEENRGWKIAMDAATYERSTYFVPRIVRMQAEMEDLVRLAIDTTRGSARAIDDPDLRAAISELCVNLHALRLHGRHILEQAERGVPSVVEGSMVKLLWSENHQRLYELAMDVLGRAAAFGPQERSAPAQGRWSREYLWTRAETILAGASEIHRNIIAERGLELPR